MTLDDFDRIALDQKYATDDGGFDALYQKAATQLAQQRPGGFPAYTPGRMAWEQLDQRQRDKALDALFSAYLVDDQREASLTQHYQDVTMQTTFLHADDLADVAAVAASGHGDVTVNGDQLWRIVHELQLLVHRAGLLRSLVTSAPMPPEALERLENDLRRDLYGGDAGEGR